MTMDYFAAPKFMGLLRKILSRTISKIILFFIIRDTLVKNSKHSKQEVSERSWARQFLLYLIHHEKANDFYLFVEMFCL
jgi:hypothetical protein